MSVLPVYVSLYMYIQFLPKIHALVNIHLISYSVVGLLVYKYVDRFLKSLTLDHSITSQGFLYPYLLLCGSGFLFIGQQVL